jgi:methylmalonyl-CoA/ethylmalonyl-CoA epimerase
VILGIDHVGIITEDPAGAGKFLTALGMHSSDAGIAAGYGVACEFWQYDRGEPSPRTPLGQARQPAVEIVSPARDDSAVSDQLTKSGPGLHHVAYEVTGIDDERARLRHTGYIEVDRAPHDGARPGMRVVFMYAPRPAGLLIELVEYTSHDAAVS